VKLVIAATPDVAIPAIKELKQHHEVVVVTQPDRPAGRGKQLKPSDVALHFPEALKPESDSELAGILKGSDLLITIGYGLILKPETLSIPTHGGINLHFSLLPKWRGAAPVQRAIQAGDKQTGVTVFQMDSGMDTGPIWVQHSYEIPPGCTSPELFDALANLGVAALEESLLKIETGENPVAQSGSASIATKVSKEECRIDWNSSATEILQKIAAFSFNPGVYSFIRGEQIKISGAELSDAKLAPGELTAAGLVGTSDHAIALLQVTPAGKRTMSVRDWLNGFKAQPGERFE
jgi:methionyl-tRNA formyltransferase